ncbi:MAG: SGNH/GDSL hydrolase family protein [Ktedonobacterales bacterium]
MRHGSRQFRCVLRAALAGLALLLAPALIAGCEGGPSGHAQAAPTATPSPVVATGTAAPRLTYVAIGASDAYGVGTTDPAHDNWPGVLARTLGPSVRLVNLGIPGATVELAARDELPVAIQTQPQLVTIFLGINDLEQGDSTDAFAAGLRGLLAALRVRTAARIYLANLPDLALLPYFGNRDGNALHQQVVAWNAVIASAARANDAVLVDLYDGWSQLQQNPQYISADGLHPSTVGAQAIAHVFAEAIAASP